MFVAQREAVTCHDQFWLPVSVTTLWRDSLPISQFHLLCVTIQNVHAPASHTADYMHCRLCSFTEACGRGGSRSLVLPARTASYLRRCRSYSAVPVFAAATALPLYAPPVPLLQPAAASDFFPWAASPDCVNPSGCSTDCLFFQCQSTVAGVCLVLTPRTISWCNKLISRPPSPFIYSKYFVCTGHPLHSFSPQKSNVGITFTLLSQMQPSGRGFLCWWQFPCLDNPLLNSLGFA